jgi:PAS domain S-box-containing protein
MYLLTEKEQLATFARNANLSVCALDDNLRIVWGSSAFYDLFKVEKEHCAELALAHLLFPAEKPEDAFFSLFHEAYAQPISGALLHSVKGFPTGSGLDLKVFRLSGEDGFIVAFNLLADQHAMERELESIQCQLDELVQHTAVPVCYNDLEGKFIRVNHAFCDLFGRTEADFLGHDFMEFHFGAYSAEEQLELRKDVCYTLRERGSIRKTIELYNKEGDLEAFNMVLRAVQMYGSPAISVQLIQNKGVQAKPESAQSDVKAFASETATQLRKPLANLQGLLEMIRSGTEGGRALQLDASALIMLSAQLADAVQKVNAVVYGLDDLRQNPTKATMQKVDSVWIVDDDQVITYITEHMLCNADNSLHISSFLSAKMALEKLRLDGFAPDVLLLDINMPGITGWEFLDQLKALNLEANVYMYSSSIDPDDVKEARNYPMVRDFISKPLDARTIRQILSLNQEQRKVS